MKYIIHIKNAFERFSSNDQIDITDQEAITISFYAMNIEQLLKINQIHEYTKNISKIFREVNYESDFI